MKNIIYMVNIVQDDRSKTQGYEWSIKSWKNWAEMNDCDVFVLDSPVYDLSEVKPQWHKLLVFDLLDNQDIEYDQILYVDSDTIVHPDCPNLFNMSENKFCGIPAIGSMDWICRSIENYSVLLFDNFIFPYWKYINSGVMLMNKNHKSLFKSILDFYFTNQEKILWMQNKLGVGTDQPVINFFLNRELPDDDRKLLPYEFNMQDMMRLEVLGEDMLHTKYGWIYHFNAGVKPSPGAWLEHTYKFLYDNIV